jgi:predicted secreted protein
MNLFLGIAIYVIVWWLSFFVMLPMGAQSPHEAGEEAVPGAERGAPKVHNLRQKALIAAGIAAIVWLGIAWAISIDLWGMRAH